jgi:uncharacterized protein with HEPN domain
MRGMRNKMIHDYFERATEYVQQVESVSAFEQRISGIRTPIGAV